MVKMIKIKAHIKGDKCLLFHKWKIVEPTKIVPGWGVGFTTYYKCEKCSARKIIQLDGGYQPIDLNFINGVGESN
jgi:hypothetical protein